MASPIPNPRYERKLVCEALDLPEVLAMVRRHPALFREAYPARTVNNIYLDSPDLADYRAHVSGVAQRTKTRIRWYGPWSGVNLAATLEGKLKLGLVSGKESFRLPALALNGGLLVPALKAALEAADLPPRWRLALAHRQPSLLSRYQRHYFQSADRRFRLTVDSGLQFAPARPAGIAAASFGAPLPRVVLELKYGPAEADCAATITNALPFRLARCSKYVVGIDSLKP